MNVRQIHHWHVVAAVATLGTIFGLHGAMAAQAGQGGSEEGVQVLTRGPVHEAFAETVTFDPAPGMTVPKAPPAAIEEVPPGQRSEGANVAWIPGYWAWDGERSDFLWVSGIWRDLPPGRQWVPGYWGKFEQRFQWTSGYWADAKVTEVQYLSEPPTTVEAGPNIAAPSQNDTWLPGCWLWQGDRYAWRPGYWAAVQPDWDWIPAHYVYAARGYVFVDGYWDYSIARRGVLFAPVYFDAALYSVPGFSYSPTTVINPAVFANHLFLRPQYQHYYFGDYYAASYQAAGFYPSYSYNIGGHGYDPIFAHERWQHRQDGQWEQRVVDDFRNRRNHEEARPPHTWAAQKELDTRSVQSKENAAVMAAPLAQLTKVTSGALRFQPVDASERRQFSQHAQAIQQFREQREKLENNTAGGPAGTLAKELAPARVPLPRSPIMAKPVAELGKQRVPPRMHEVPKPDLTVEAKPRVARSTERPQPHTVNRLPLDTAQPRPQPKVERPESKPQPRTERPEPQPRTERPEPQPRPQPKADGPAPRQAADTPSAGPNQEKHAEKGRSK